MGDLASSASSSTERDEEQLHWLALRLVPGLGHRVALRLAKTFGSAAAVFHASPTELEALDTPSHVVRSLAAASVFDQAAQEAERARQLGVSILLYSDESYPSLLREIFDPPLLLYARGNVGLLASPAIAIVGSRRPTAYGRAIAQRLASDLAARGLLIVSGLARGIDSAAHQGAMDAQGRDAQGKTIAVLGAGVDVVYPAENKKLFAAIAETGLLLSEFPMGSFPAPQNFPIRNRILSGISAGVIVVEAAEHSGSLITARLAMEQNREVFAVPGSLMNKNSWGPHVLIKQGAKLLQDWQDVIEELPSPVRRRLVPLGGLGGRQDEAASRLSESLSETERAIYDLLKSDEALHIDGVLEALPSFSSSEVLASLLELEFKNLVRQLPGKNFIKTF